MFLRQVILQNGIPFEVKYPELGSGVMEAMEEACNKTKLPLVDTGTRTDLYKK